MNPNVKGPANPRYKTMMCKNYNSEQGCQYADKCQFAHGPDELRQFSGMPMMPMQPHPNKPMDKLQKNIMNYKIVKCKNYEKDGSCRYGAHCSFAHGDAELRTKNDPLAPQMYINPGMPGMVFPPMMDYMMMPMPSMQPMPSNMGKK